jgi:UPF0755 protein
MKKIILALLVLVLMAIVVVAWLVAGSGTAFSDKRTYLYVKTGKTDKSSVMSYIAERNLLKNPSVFQMLANRMNVWDKLKPGRYEIEKGESVLTIARKLRNNNQSPVKLVINKVRTNHQLAELIAKNFEAPAAQAMEMVSNDDSLRKLGVDTNTLMTLVIPNTYSILWTTPPQRILQRLKKEQENFWKKNDRKNKAQNLGLSEKQVYTIASIVEEETNKQEDKGKIASVYINRMQRGMPLGADPTIKFALKDFSLKRIYHKHLDVASPYNTYRNAGLPPGPICTPSPKTIDAVLDAPKTDYIFFVAKSDFSGYHVFSSNYAEHQQYAKEYQKALDEWMLKKQNSSR